MKRKKIPEKEYIYIISNPSFQGWFKIGRTKDPDTRLRCYQTCSPNRDYKMDYLLRVKDATPHEKYFSDKCRGEWIQSDLYSLIKIIEAIEGYVDFEKADFKPF